MRRHPDELDGVTAWRIVAVAFAATFTTFGIAYSFGAFLLPMSADLEAGRGATAGVFSVTTLAFFGLGGLSGAAVDRLGPRQARAGSCSSVPCRSVWACC